MADSHLDSPDRMANHPLLPLDSPDRMANHPLLPLEPSSDSIAMADRHIESTSTEHQPRGAVRFPPSTLYLNPCPSTVAPRPLLLNPCP